MWYPLIIDSKDKQLCSAIIYGWQAGKHVESRRRALPWLWQHVHACNGLMASHVHVLCIIGGCGYLPGFLRLNFICQNPDSGFLSIFYTAKISCYTVYCRTQWRWFQTWPFLHYDYGTTFVFCRICVKTFTLKWIRTRHNSSTAFVKL